MNKVKSILLSKNQVHNSPSPDSKRSNRVQSTISPMQEIQKILNMNRQPIKLKKQISSQKFIPSNQKSQKIQKIDSIKQQQYKNRIYQLEEQLAHYKNYVEEYQQIAYKNKRLQEQMSFILQQLQNRTLQNQNNQIYQQKQSPISKNRNQNITTIQSSHESYCPQINLQSQRARYRYDYNQRDQQIQNLYEYIQNLQGTMKQLVNQSKQMQLDIKKNTKKDLNQMQQRLMNYIFGLQQRVSQATFRNNDIAKKFETFRQRQQQYILSKSKRSRRQSQSQVRRKMQDFGGDTSSLMKLSMTDNKSIKKDKIDRSVDSKMDQEQRTVKKAIQIRQSQDNFKISVNKCLKCTQYISIINQLNQKSKGLQQEISMLRTKISLRKKSSQQKFHKKLIKQQKQSQKSLMNEQFRLQTDPIQQQLDKQDQRSSKSKSHQKIYQRVNTLQSHINIIMDSSASQYSERPDIQHSFVDNLKIQSQNAQNSIRLQKVKQQLANVMALIKQIIHQCQLQPKNSMVNQLNRKIRIQTQYISQLEQQVSKLRIQIQENRINKQKLQKFMNQQNKQQQQMGSPYFRPLSQPISCIDHDATKGKLTHILKSIKEFQIELNKTENDNQEMEIHK